MKEADIFSQKIFREFTRSILFGWTSERFRSAVPKYVFCLLVFYIGAAGASSKSYIVTCTINDSTIFPHLQIYYAYQLLYNSKRAREPTFNHQKPPSPQRPRPRNQPKPPRP